MSESYLEKIIPFICNMRVQSDDSESPSASLFEIKEGDLFTDIHFNTSITPKKEDFNFSMPEYYDGNLEKILFGYKWHYDKDKPEDYITEGPMVYWADAGTDMEGYRPEGEVLAILLFNAYVPLYVNKYAKEFFEYSKYPLPIESEGWQGETLKELFVKYDMEYSDEYLAEGAYGEVFVDPELEVEIGDGEWNGKLIGFTQEDYKEE